MEIKYLQVLVMPNGEVICEGKALGLEKNFEKYLRSLEEMGEEVDEARRLIAQDKADS